MTTLIAGLVIFLGIHSISIVAEGFRNRMAAKSELGWKGFYGLIAALGLYLIISGYAEARLNPTLIYVAPAWTRHLAALLLLPVFILLLATYFPGRVNRLIAHPMLVAVKLWALAHLLVNGMLADLLLFGGFLVWAVADRISMKRRQPRAVPGLPRSGINDLIVVGGGLGLYVVFTLWLHQLLIGIRPFG